MEDMYKPKKEDKFCFGLWTVGNPGGDAFGTPTRKKFSPIEIVENLSRIGAFGVSLHDNDLIPLGSDNSEKKKIVSEFKESLDSNDMKVGMVTTNLFSHPVFKDGAFTSNSGRVRAAAFKKVIENIDLSQELGAEIFVFWGGREGVEVDASKNPIVAIQRMREAMDFFSDYAIDMGYNIRFSLEAKPNEPRGDIFLPTTGAMLGFIETLKNSEMFGVNPENAHELISGLNVSHAYAQAMEMKKLFLIHLNSQKMSRYDQDLRFGSEDYKGNFFTVKVLEDNNWNGIREFDAHAYRTENAEGVWDFALGCMRSYNIFREKVKIFNKDEEVISLLKEINSEEDAYQDTLSDYTKSHIETLKNTDFDYELLAKRRLSYERLDQLVFEILMGAR